MSGGACSTVALSAQDGYDLLSPYYDHWHWQTFWEKNEVGLVRRIISQLPKAHRAIDLGTGTGRYLSILNDGGVPAIGTDISDRMLARAAAKLGKRHTFVHADLTKLPFANHIFDLAISCRVLSHIRNLNIAFAELSRIIRPGGHVIFSDLDGAHGYNYTQMTIPDGRIAIATYKRNTSDIIRHIYHTRQWSILAHFKIDALTAHWLPNTPCYMSIDRTGIKPIANIFVMRRIIDAEAVPMKLSKL